MKPYYKKRGIFEAKKHTDKRLKSSKKCPAKIRIYRGAKKAMRQENQRFKTIYLNRYIKAELW